MSIEHAILIVVASYLLGSVVGAYVVSSGTSNESLKRSGNPGVSNTLRQSGKRTALGVALIDVGKGWLVLFVALNYLPDQQPGWLLPSLYFAVIFGHIFPVFHRFHGGKGVATMLGAWLAIYWQLGLALLILWGFIALITRYASVASLSISWLGLPVLLYILPYQHIHQWLSSVLIVSILVTYRHHENLQRLWKGEENSLPFSWGREKTGHT